MSDMTGIAVEIDKQEAGGGLLPCIDQCKDEMCTAATALGLK